jgi:hypothetical protein
MTRAGLTNAQQVFCGRIQRFNEQVVVEDNDGCFETVKYKLSPRRFSATRVLLPVGFGGC